MRTGRRASRASSSGAATRSRSAAGGAPSGRWSIGSRAGGRAGRGGAAGRRGGAAGGRPPRAPADPDVRRALGGEDGRPLLGVVAGLRVMKGHRVVIEALARLAGQGVRPRVVFVGRGAMEPALRQAVARAGMEAQIAFAGFVSDVP